MLQAGAVDSRRRLVGVQYLRAIAALMVVVHHANDPKSYLWDPLAGYNAFAWGVDIFFVISGFIMVVSASGDRPGRFLLKRAIRIIPLYWAATFAALLLTQRTAILSTPPQQWGHIVLSLLFVPHYSPTAPDRVYPYLVPGWTLNYEMFFYLLFAVGLAFRRPVLFATVSIGALSVIGLIFQPTDAILWTYTSPQLLEFLAGVWIGWLYRRGALRSAWLGLLIPIGFTGLMLQNSLRTDELWRWPWMVAAAAAIVVGTVALERWTPYLRFPALLGDASYSIYLTHVLIAIKAADWVSRHLTDDWPGPWQFAAHLAVALAVAILVGLVFYWLVERPSLRWLRARLLVRSPRTTPTATP